MMGSRLMHWILGCLLAAVAVVGCTGDTTSGEGTGALSLDLVIGDGIVINQVDWRITGNEMDMSDTINVSAPGSTASVEVFGLPPGDEDYRVMLTAVSVDEEVTCAGSADFNVEVGEVTDVMVMLNCKLPQRFGAVRVNGTFNICAELIKAVVAPLETSIGNDIDLSAQGVDEDPNDQITYNWSGGGGSFADPNAASTTYTCEVIGQHEITVSVTDNDDFCDMAQWTVVVTCVTGGVECTDPSQCEDQRECTTNLCEAGDCVFESIAAGESCPVSDGVCDGEGNCVECVSAGECPDDELECTEAPSCTDNACDPQDNLPNGTGCASVVDGMCMDGICEPPPICIEPDDCPDDELECTTNLCEAEECVYEPIAAGEACPQSDGVCDGEGACVQCVVPGDCPDDGNDCTEAPSCTSNTCDPQDNLPNGTDCASVVDGMCMDGVCEPPPICTEPDDCPDDELECTTNLCEAADCVYEPIAAGEACPQSDGVCDGQGNCVECLTEGDCPDDGNDCTAAPSCTDNACDPQDNLPNGTDCTSVVDGMCMDGICVAPIECTEPDDCPDDELECTTNLCEAQDCVYEPIAAEESCPQSDGVCDGEGNCVECVSAANCPDDELECTTNLCEAEECVYEPIAVGESCPVSDGLCDGEGDCVQCVGPGDCPDDGNECTEAPSCTDNTCDPQDNLPDNTECSIGTCQAGVCEPTTDDCFECQQTNCQDYLGFNWFAACYDDTILAEEGPAAGTPKNELCETYLDCALTMPAETGDPVCGSDPEFDVLCYCGPGFSGNANACLQPDVPDGPCMSEAEDAAETTTPQTVGQRFFEPGFALGHANWMLRCINANCTSECYP